jgi:UDP-N-acetyl-D-mannosaminuronic acid dehydrogenase
MSLQEAVGLYGSQAPATDQREALLAGRVPVAVYGLGKMGLPLAAVIAEVTGNVTGVDVDPAVVERVAAGESHLDHEPGLTELVAETVDRGHLTATTDGTRAASEATVHVVVVPVGVTDGGADLSILRAAVETVGSGLSPGDLVVVESTIPPGTCRDVVTPLLETTSELSLGEFGVAFCPERTSSGRALRDIQGAYPKIVGGVDPESTRAATVFYDEMTTNEVLAVGDATTAECVKVFEGVYRDVNIALANELATFADELDVDVTAAIDAANTQPFCDIHDPGPGVGGHCIPLYPYFLLERFGDDAPLLQTARDVNDGMPAFTVRTLERELAEVGVTLADARVAVLGLAYRPGIPETTKSPARPIAASLAARGATVYGVDPVVEDVSTFEVTPATLEEFPTLELDAVVVVTPHAEFETVDWSALDPMVVVDGHRTLDLADTHHRVYAIGRGRLPTARERT